MVRGKNLKHRPRLVALAILLGFASLPHWAMAQRIREIPRFTVNSVPTERPDLLAPSEAGSDVLFAKVAEALRKKLPDDFTVLVEKPFVVIGNQTPDEVSNRATETVRWAVDRLKKQFFEKDPDHIILVWLFKDKETYEGYTQKLYGHRPKTPFGYYSPAHRALIMNISTGGGTLVHEIVHPYISANFPNCPTWFNEGLASLYEQCGDREGRIVGMTNWRLRSLQKAIREKKLLPFETLCQTTRDEFYGKNKNLNYAQARYLMYYLDKQGLLEKFYHTLRENIEDDPTGVETLKTILDTDDLVAFQRKWEYFILTLRF